MVSNPSHTNSFSLKITKFIVLSYIVLHFSNCAMVPQMDREYLSDPIMQLSEDNLESSMEGHNFPRREGSTGGNAGAGGGCGC